MARKFTQEEIIEKFIDTHSSKFDYSKFKYVQNIRTKSLIKCIKHNRWIKISAFDHLRYISGGCSKCNKEHMSKIERMNIEVYIRKANKIHKNKYDYSLVHQFQNQQEKIKIICPLHGGFEKYACNHIHYKLKQGCEICGTLRGAKKISKTTEYFIKKSQIKHGKFYDYSLVNYTIERNKVIIICPKHGKFEQIANYHLAGNGCNECGKIKNANAKKITNEIFVKAAKKIHGNKYDYSNLVWTNSDTEVEIICKKCGPFTILPHNHTTLKRGCTSCGKKMRIRQNAWLDYLKISDDKKHREVTIKLDGIVYRMDGYDPLTNTVYEFHGDYWHGNPKKYNPNKINPSIGVKFGTLYKKTKEKEKKIRKGGFKLVTIWESDWDIIHL